MSSCRPIDTPISTSKFAKVSDCLFSDPIYFQKIIGALQYFTFMRLNIFFIVNKVCQYMHAPTDAHWAVVKCIIHYFKGIVSFSLHITCSSFFSLHGFTDADWVRSV